MKKLKNSGPLYKFYYLEILQKVNNQIGTIFIDYLGSGFFCAFFTMEPHFNAFCSISCILNSSKQVPIQKSGKFKKNVLWQIAILPKTKVSSKAYDSLQKILVQFLDQLQPLFGTCGTPKNTTTYHLTNTPIIQGVKREINQYFVMGTTFD